MTVTPSLQQLQDSIKATGERLRQLQTEREALADKHSTAKARHSSLKAEFPNDETLAGDLAAAEAVARMFGEELHNLDMEIAEQSRRLNEASREYERLALAYHADLLTAAELEQLKADTWAAIAGPLFAMAEKLATYEAAQRDLERMVFGLKPHEAIGMGLSRTHEGAVTVNFADGAQTYPQWSVRSLLGDVTKDTYQRWQQASRREELEAAKAEAARRTEERDAVQAEASRARLEAAMGEDV